MNEKQFIEALKEQGIELSTEQIGQFKTYFEMLVEWNEKINRSCKADRFSLSGKSIAQAS